jgi:hypothetical protein
MLTDAADVKDVSAVETPLILDQLLQADRTTWNLVKLLR